MVNPVIKGYAGVLVHSPDLVPYGSKPSRELPKNEVLGARLRALTRSYQEALSYPPHQVFIGNYPPDWLRTIPEPWFENGVAAPKRFGPYGEIMPEEEFYLLLKAADAFNLVCLEQGFLQRWRPALASHPLSSFLPASFTGSGSSLAEIEDKVAREGAVPLTRGQELVGCLCQGHDEDATLTASVLLENLACKASGFMALAHLFRPGQELRPEGFTLKVLPEGIEYVLSCSEEAVGDRYQRGGGNLAKAIGEMAGCLNASGSDVKAFCAAPVHALLVAAGLVQAEVFGQVAVVAGGSLAKLGMKFLGHLAKGQPVLEDVLGGVAFVVGADDGINPVVRLDALGKHDVGSGSSPQAITEALVLKPLKHLGKPIVWVDKYAVELHNPEITVPAGSGNVPRTNYRMIGALAASLGQIEKGAIELFCQEHGLPGYAPTQGHIASAICFLGHARDMLLEGKVKNVMLVAKGSLFLGRMTHLWDGLSLLLVANPALGKGGTWK